MALKFKKTELENLYLTQKLTPDKIAAIYGCNHKTVRKYIKSFGIKERTPQEYNFLPRASHVNPPRDQLMSPLSIMAHMAYLCEGNTKGRPGCLDFCNCNLKLIEVVRRCLYDLYQVKTYHETIYAPSGCLLEQAQIKFSHPHQKVVVDDTIRKPLIVIRSGGLNLAADFIKNAQWILGEIQKQCDENELISLSSKVSHNINLKYGPNPSWNFTPPSEKELRGSLSLAGHTLYLCEGHNNGDLVGLNFTNTNVSLLNVYMGFLARTYNPIKNRIYLTGARETNIPLADKLDSSNIFRPDITRKIAIAHIKTTGKELIKVFQLNANALLDDVLANLISE